MSDRNVRKVRVGKVVSDKMDKTVVVAVEELEQHKMYKKPVKKTVKFHAHDEKNDAHIGDRVSIMETRPLSKTKRWRVVVLDKDGRILVEADVGTVGTADSLDAADDDRLDDIALLHRAARRCRLDGGDDNIADVGILTV